MNKKKLTFKRSEIPTIFRVKRTTPPIFFETDECYSIDVCQYTEELSYQSMEVNCSLCGKVYSNKFKLKQHELSHNASKCVLCGRRISNEMYKKHLMKCRKNPNFRRKAKVLLECIKEDLDGEDKENAFAKRGKSANKKKENEKNLMITNFFHANSVKKGN